MKKILIAITAVFFAAMLVLTFTARSIHNAGLPHVSVKRVETALFTDEYSVTQAIAVTSEQYEQGVYVHYSSVINGEKRDFIRRAEIIAGQESGGYVEVISGLTFIDRIVIEADRELRDGEVFLEK